MSLNPFKRRYYTFATPLGDVVVRLDDISAAFLEGAYLILILRSGSRLSLFYVDERNLLTTHFHALRDTLLRR